MKTLQFKTNINCAGCVAKVTPHLNEEANIKNWKVDTTNPQKILTIETESISAKEIIKMVSKAGFKIEELS